MQHDSLEQRIQTLEDKAALKALVDAFSNLADQKDLATQALLFTEDAVVDTYFEGQLFASLKGRKEIEDTFSGFMANFETSYHLNGQHTAELDGDRATAVHYCLVVLVNTVDGKKTRHTNGVYYNDEYVRQGSQWLISKRTSYFTWRDQQLMGQS
ncbi:nuclear transport factor 2 family protein (plasmid) [Rhizobium lusitanum]|uniref:nuclear transport factor 2 family protein n=1 Tax=Rhizobium lusitanum TaxID=293958 RepID=UPI00161A7E9C|nr:nuclear transport factor 2 family protein [Rhizobium lusitanum]QND45596.1 nuclear transport factor 2 family protein [Rhizobium lusitanum]